MRGTAREKKQLCVSRQSMDCCPVPNAGALFSFTLGPAHVANPELMLSRVRTCHIHRASSVPMDIAHTVMEGLCGGPWCYNLFWLEL